MKLTLHLYPLLFLLTLLFSCKGQQKTEKVITKPIEKSAPDKTDYDPYFVETEDIYLSKGPSSITRNILEDKDGNIWFASWEGIVRYEPAKELDAAAKPFTNFTNKDGLRRYHVFSVLRDSKEHLWFGTIRGGLYRYDPTATLKQNGTAFRNITTKQGLSDDLIGCMMEDRSGKIWIGTAKGISVYDPNTVIGEQGAYFQNHIMEGESNNNDINSIVEDRTGNFWIGTRGEVSYYDGKTFKFFKDKNGLPLRNVRSIIEDRNGKIWLGGNEGLWSYDPSVGVQSFTLYTRDFVGYIYEDSKGNVWVGSDESGNRDWLLTQYSADALAKGSLEGELMRRQKGQIFGILEDSKGNIWFGHERGVCRFDTDPKFKNYMTYECFNH